VLPPFFKYLIPFLIVITIMIVLWMILNFNRFGPPLDEEPPVRRSLLEHVQASGRLIWRLGGRNNLLESVRRRLLHKIELRYPGWIHLERTKLVSNLAELTKVPEEDVRYAIESLVANNETEFTRIVTTLETLRKSL
jgi:hypothetical protein